MATSFGPYGWARPPNGPVDLEKAPFSWIEEEAIWNFLHRHIQHPLLKKPQRGLVKLDELSVWRRFCVELGSQRPLQLLKDHVNNVMVPKLANEKLPSLFKMQLFCGLDIPINSDFVTHLQERGCKILLNAESRVVYFKHGTTELMNIQPNFPERLSIDEEMEIWTDLLQRIHGPNTGHICRGEVLKRPINFFKSFVSKHKWTHPPKHVMEVFQYHMMSTLQQSHLSTLDKVKLVFALEIPLEPKFRNELEQTANITLCSRGCIVTYNEKSKAGLRLNSEDLLTYGELYTKNPFLPFTEEEDYEMWLYAVNKSRDPETGLVTSYRAELEMVDTWLPLEKKNKAKRPAGTYMRRFRNILLPKLDETEFEDDYMKLLLYFVLQVPINREFLKKMRRETNIFCDSEFHVVECRPFPPATNTDPDNSDVILVEPKEEKKVAHLLQ